MSRFNKKTIICFYLLVSLLIGIGLAGIYWRYLQDKITIASYTPNRDREFVLRSARHDHYWLSAHPAFNPQFIFDTATPQNDRSYAGKLVTKVLLENDRPVGFVSFYAKSSADGRILFLLVDAAARGKGYGARLLEMAMDELARQGMKKVVLAVRDNNLNAIRLYKKMGFVESRRVEEFIFLQRKLPYSKSP